MIQKNDVNTLMKIRSFNLSELRQFSDTSITTSIACAGNRWRQLKNLHPEIKGVSWDLGAIGNNKYKGILVKNLLLKSGYSEE